MQAQGSRLPGCGECYHFWPVAQLHFVLECKLFPRCRGPREPVLRLCSSACCELGPGAGLGPPVEVPEYSLVFLRLSSIPAWTCLWSLDLNPCGAPSSPQHPVGSISALGEGGLASGWEKCCQLSGPSKPPSSRPVPVTPDWHCIPLVVGPLSL